MILRLPLKLVLPGLLALAPAVPALGLTDPWEFEVYPYSTLPAGMGEIESANAFVSAGHSVGGIGTASGTIPSEHLLYHSYELTYGLTDRIETALYLNLARAPGAGLRWAGDKLRFRGHLFDPGVLPVDIGWYLELEWHKAPQFDDAVRELEFRPILEKDFGALAVMVNPKFEKVLAGAGHSQGVEFGYVAGVQYRAWRRASPGLEFYGGTGLIDQADPVQSQQHYLFPSLWGELPGGVEYNIGVGFGLTHGSDPVIFKVNLELERFVGKVFHANPDTGWFF